MPVICHFHCLWNECEDPPFDRVEMDPPQIGSKIFKEGSDDVFKVIDVQYQLVASWPSSPDYKVGALKLVNVIITKEKT